ncbi:MAG TPA: CheR family methyltransferase, partial [Dehalococcoidales bacterium]
LATDINISALQKAWRGIYSEWSFRDCPRWVKQKYFHETANNRFEIIPEVKKLVTFGYHNLAQDPYPSLLNGTNAMDIIFCRNVLMYFGPQRARQVTEDYYKCLTEGGWLFVSPVEISQVLYEKYHSVQHAGIFLYRKDNQRKKTSLPPLIHNHYAAEVPPSVVSPPLPKTKSVKVKSMPPPPNQYEKALTFYRQGQLEEAEPEAAIWLSHHPADTRAMVLLARIQANLGKLTLAAEHCQQGIAADKLNPFYYYLMATIEQELGRSEAAVQSLKRALYLDQNFVLAHFALGNLCRQSGRLAESRRYFINAQSLLAGHPAEENIPEGEGITTGRLLEIIRAISSVETSV